jgi:ferric-dicitrate binding protein FerR (iron transport regulator)
VIKLDNGQLKYLKGKQGQMPGGTIYNTISTPRGGQYQVVLADGSKIWLNASSSLRFPTEFRDKIREVEVTGEAYCEIAHNASKPFRLKVKEMQVTVLGTHFDVMAYDNESTIKTTLLEGSLRVSNATGASLIAPGQQAVLHKNGSFQLVPNADVEEAVAWKNGKFVFSSADIHTIMRQVERWYNVDISFEREADLHFTGQLSRYVNVSELLRKLELTNEVHFRIEKGRITVLP